MIIVKLTTNVTRPGGPRDQPCQPRASRDAERGSKINTASQSTDVRASPAPWTPRRSVWQDDHTWPCTWYTENTRTHTNANRVGCTVRERHDPKVIRGIEVAVACPSPCRLVMHSEITPRLLRDATVRSLSPPWSAQHGAQESTRSAICSPTCMSSSSSSSSSVLDVSPSSSSANAGRAP